MSSDVFFDNGQPVQHAMCEQTGVSELELLHSMEASAQAEAFEIQWLFEHGPPSTLKVDQGQSNKAFRKMPEVTILFSCQFRQEDTTKTLKLKDVIK